MTIYNMILKRLLQENVCKSIGECRRFIIQDAIKIDLKNNKIKIGQTKEIDLDKELTNDRLNKND